jgi:hypothetical protein
VSLNGHVFITTACGISITHVYMLSLASFTTVHAGIWASITLLFPEDCIITGANIFHILSLVLILFVHIRNHSAFDFDIILQIQLLYQLAINLVFITDSEEELGKSIISSDSVACA